MEVAAKAGLTVYIYIYIYLYIIVSVSPPHKERDVSLW